MLLNNSGMACLTKTFQSAATAYARPLLVVAFAFLFTLQLMVCVIGMRLGSDGRADFRAMYTAAYMLRTGQRHQIYDIGAESTLQKTIVSDSMTLPFIHPAAETVFFWPLTFLSYRTAYFVFALVNSILLIYVAILMRPFLPELGTVWKPLPFAVFLCYLPAGFVIALGQTQLLVLLMLSLAFVAEKKGNNFYSGILLGLTIIRFQIAIPIGILLLAWRRPKALMGFLISASAVIGASVLLVGLQESVTYLRALKLMATGLATRPEQVGLAAFPGMMPNIRGLVFKIGLQDKWGLALTSLASVSLLIVAAKQRASLALAATVAILVGHHNNIADLTLLALPLAIGLDEGSWLRAGPALFAPALYGPLLTRGLIPLLAIPAFALASAFVSNKPQRVAHLPS
jgi:glycosyl transferase family 87